MSQLNLLETEQRNPCSLHIDTMSTADILNTINAEDGKVADAAAAVIPQLTILVDEAVKRIKQGGRLIYVGAGTSGRLGVLDASECPPTYGVSADMVQAVIAGGKDALYHAAEGAEDNERSGRETMQTFRLTALDTVLGIAASGRTPYVIGALTYANEIGAYTGSLSCTSGSEISGLAKTALEVNTGPEVITGSTRMKAGTAQKIVLNMLSTSIMIKLGKVYENLMIDVRPTNDKLIYRAKKIISQCVKCDMDTAAKLFEASGHQVKLAACMGLSGLSKTTCEKLLERNEQNLSLAINSLKQKGEIPV